MAEHNSEIHNTHSHAAEEIEAHIGIPGYVAVFAFLFIMTIITYTVALTDLDSRFFAGANTFVALLIAFAKMTAVVLFFMHVRWQSRLIWLTALAGFFWLAIMFAFTMQDYLTRGAGIFTR